jgi:hypothetical protein
MFYPKRKMPLFVVLLLLTSSLLRAQNIEDITLRKPIKLSGSLNASSVMSFGLPNNSDPFNYFLSGNMNFNLFGVVNVPVSVNYSDRKVVLSQSYSFNQISINPTYKWATAHLGTNYMSFSPYTLNGHQSLGGGIELRPGNWEIQALGGQFRRGQSLDDNAFISEFRRNGYGGKVAYNNGKFVVGANFVRSGDIDSSLPISERITEEGLVINPEENLAIGLQAGTTLFNALQVDVEYANSVITKDRSSEFAETSLNSLAGMFLNTNATSESFDAVKANLGYNVAKTQTIIGLGYERIDPGYTTHGGYYFVENIINYTANVTQSLRQNTISLFANIGVQQDGIEVKNASRVVGSLNASFQPNDKFTADLNLSNFQSFIFIDDILSQATRLPGQPIDSLDFQLISQNIGVSTTYLFNSTEKQSNGISTNINYLNSRDNRIRTEAEGDGTTSVLNATLSYSLNYLETNFGLNAGLNVLNNSIEGNKTFGIGPTLALQKGFLDGKISTNTSLTLLRTKADNLTGNESFTSTVTNLTTGGTYQPADKHSFFLNAGIVNNASIKAFINGTLGYTFSF